MDRRKPPFVLQTLRKFVQMLVLAVNFYLILEGFLLFFYVIDPIAGASDAASAAVGKLFLEYIV